MKINITIPANYTYKKLVNNTKLYLDDDSSKKTIFVGKNKEYYVWVQKKGIVIELVTLNERSIEEIQKYLEFLFHGTYIGISCEGTKKVNLNLKDVKCFDI